MQRAGAGEMRASEDVLEKGEKVFLIVDHIFISRQANRGLIIFHLKFTPDVK